MNFSGKIAYESCTQCDLYKNALIKYVLQAEVVFFSFVMLVLQEKSAYEKLNK